MRLIDLEEPAPASDWVLGREPLRSRSNRPACRVQLVLVAGDCASNIGHRCRPPISRPCLISWGPRLFYTFPPCGRWAQQLAGLDFLAPPPAGGVAPTAGAADGHVLAGLAVSVDHSGHHQNLFVLKGLSKSAAGGSRRCCRRRPRPRTGSAMDLQAWRMVIQSRNHDSTPLVASGLQRGHL